MYRPVKGRCTPRTVPRTEGAPHILFCEKRGVGLTVVPPVCLPDGTLISSSAIRDALHRGDRRLAETMLNRPLSQREEVLLGGRYNE